MGLWLGIWAWCFVGSLAVGFLLGAVVTAHLNPSWGFYFVVIILAIFLLMNVVAPETRRAPHRRSVLHYFDEGDNLKKKVARGEVMLHLSSDGPKYWYQEVFAGMKLMTSMLIQPGFLVLAVYTAWVYALVVLVTLASTICNVSGVNTNCPSCSVLFCRLNTYGGHNMSALPCSRWQLALRLLCH